MDYKPETRVTPGSEQQALDAHIRRMAHWAAHRHLRALTENFEADERARRKLLKLALILAAVFCALAIVVVWSLMP